MNDKIINGIPIAGWRKSNWLWSLPLYLACGVPYVTVFFTAIVFFNRMGLSNSAISFVSALCFLPIALRPLLERVVVWYGTKRRWIILTELVVIVAVEILALALYSRFWLPISVFLLVAIVTAGEIHSVAIKYFYRLSTVRRQRRASIIIRTVMCLMSIAVLFALPAMVAGNLEVINRTIQSSWTAAFHIVSAIMLVLLIFHIVFLPHPVDMPSHSAWKSLQFRLKARINLLARQNNMLLVALFVFILPESMFSRVVPLFLIDPGSNGGLSLSPQEIALVLGTVGTFSLIIGIILGARAIRIQGLRRSFWPMALAITLPKALYIYLSYSFTSSLWLINSCIFVEQLCLGFGIMVYTTIVFEISSSSRAMFSHSFAISLIAFSIFLGSLIAGILEEYIGYRQFFIIVTLLGLPVLAAAHVFYSGKTNRL